MVNETKSKKRILNNLVSFIKSDDTLQLYFNQDAFENMGMAKSEDFLIDALEQLQNFISKDNSIKQVETLFDAKHIELLTNLGFDVNTLVSQMPNAKENMELKNASISADKLLSDEWEKIKKERIATLISHKVGGEARFNQLIASEKMIALISEKMAKEVHLPDVSRVSYAQKDIDIEKVALDFFKSIDEEFYDKAKAMFEGKSDIDIKIYEKDDDKIRSERKDCYIDLPVTNTDNGKTTIYIPLNHNIRDIMTLVHEITHTFDMSENNIMNPVRHIMTEIGPRTMELLLRNYLMDQDYFPKEEILAYENNRAGFGELSKGNYAQLQIMEQQRKSQVVTADTIEQICDELDLDENGSKMLRCDILNGRDLTNNVRDMMSALFVPHFGEMYSEDPKQAIINLKKYMDAIKRMDLIGALAAFDVQPTPECIDKLIETVNERNGVIQAKDYLALYGVKKQTLTLSAVKATEEKTGMQSICDSASKIANANERGKNLEDEMTQDPFSK